MVELPEGSPTWKDFCYFTPDETTLYYDHPTQGVCVSHWIGETYHVDGAGGNDNNDGTSRVQAWATIQKGIDEVRNGDMILVWPGVYEGIDFVGKAITVRSVADAAVIDDGIGVWFDRGEGPGSVLENFVIRNAAIDIICVDSSPTLQHLTVVDSDYGIVAYNESNPNINHCILWNNAHDDLFQCQARYSCIEDGDAGVGNFSVDPLFADAGSGDYHLQSERGRWAGSFWVLDEQTSPCVDAGDPAIQPTGERMPNGARLNIGAYGGSAWASISEWPVREDLNFDGIVNLQDIAILMEKWLWKIPWFNN